MCLSTVYKLEADEREKVAEYVSSVRADGDAVILVDIMGIETTVAGQIRSMDLVNNEIIIVSKEG